MTIKLFILATTLFSLHVFAQEDMDNGQLTKKGNYQIDNRYKGGSFLIYNCEKGYYTCVDEDGFNLCKDKRQKAMDSKKAAYPCAPLKQFSDKIKCGEKNYEVVESLAKKRFCYPK